MRPNTFLRATALFYLVAPAIVLIAVAGCKSTAIDQPDKTPGDGGTRTSVSPTELRGLFVATAFNLDWPSRPGLESHLSKDEIDAIISRAVDLNCNAIFLQVRAFGDRIYLDPKNKHPEVLWSVAFDTSQKNPDPLYDPLREWITRAHANGLELHVWLNPYRIDKPIVAPGSTDKIPLPCIDGQDKFLYLDPTSPQVQDYLTKLVEDFMQDYGGKSKLMARPPQTAIRAPGLVQAVAPPATATTTTTDDDGADGVVIDHYFPPEGGKDPKTISDRRDWALRQAQAQWKAHVPPIVVPVGDANATVQALMQSLYAVVEGKYHKPFGISPKHDQLSTIKAWLKSATPFADYLAPEIYSMQPTTFANRLSDWLATGSSNESGQNIVVVPVLNTSAVQSPDASGNLWDPSKIKDEMTGSGDDVVGYIHYSYHALRSPMQGGPQGTKNLGEDLKQSQYKDPKPAGQWHKPVRATPTLKKDATGIILDPGTVLVDRWVYRINGTGGWIKLAPANGNLIPAAQLNGPCDVEVVAITADHHRSAAAKVHWP